MAQHAKSFLKMMHKSHQYGKSTFFSLMCDYRDPQFPMELGHHTKGVLRPGVLNLPKDKRRNWTLHDMKTAAIRKAEGLRLEGKLHANRSSEYFDSFQMEWGTYKWKEGSGQETPEKKDDDIMDTMLTAVWALWPRKVKDLDYGFRLDKEPPIRYLITKKK